MPDTLARMRQLIGTTAQWSANNLVLGDGEIGVEVVDANTRRFKVGDGSRTWSALPYSTVSQAALDTEIANRSAADATLQANINAEASTRATADTNETTARQAADTAETNARIAADNAEITARGNADATLQTNINNEAATRATNDTAEATTRANADSAEITARQAGDTAEANARTAADATLQTNINTEAATRATNDTAEATTRLNADNALDARLDVIEAANYGGRIAGIEAGLASETAQRTAADTALDARLDTLEGQNLDARVDALEAEISTVPPAWVARGMIGGVEKMARLHVKFPSADYWCDGQRTFDYLIGYQAPDPKLYCDDAGKFLTAAPNVPVITAHGLMLWRTATSSLKYNRDPRINWRISVTGISGGEFWTDGETITSSAGGSGIAINEGSILLLANWTGAAPVLGQTLTGANAVAAVGSTVQQQWIHNNVAIVRDQPGLGGEASTGCRITALAANATVTQAVTLTSSTRRSLMFARRVVGVGEVAMTVDGGATWYPKAVTEALYGRFASDVQTLANPTVGIRLATIGDSIVVDWQQVTDRGPSQAECYRPGQTSGVGLAALPGSETRVSAANLTQPLAWIKRTVGTFINDRTRMTIVTKLLPQTANPGGTELQFDTDGTDGDCAIQNRSTEGTPSNNNFGTTYRTQQNPSGFGNDPQGPKGTANVPHTVAWTMNANDTGAGMGMGMIVADGSGAEVNVNHLVSHFPRGLQFIRIGMQWATNLMPSGLAGYNPTTGFVTEFAVFDGVPSAEELEALAPGSQFVPPAALMAAEDEAAPALASEAAPTLFDYLDADEAPVSGSSGASAIRFRCPRSPAGKTRRCIHPLRAMTGTDDAPTLAEPLTCPGCGFHGRLTAGVFSEGA